MKRYPCLGIACLMVGLAVLAALGTDAAFATTVPQMTVREMLAASSFVVYGRVESATSRWNEDRTLIMPDVRIQVLDALKGGAGTEVVVTQPGGRVGKLRVDVDGASGFLPGEEAVLFLAPGPGNETNVIGLSRGRFDVATDAQSGRKTVRGLDAADLRTVRALRPSTAGAVTVPETGGPLDLDEFLGGIRHMAAEAGAKGGK